jgi:membrane protease YdiL (CAAX protease family)
MNLFVVRPVKKFPMFLRGFYASIILAVINFLFQWIMKKLGVDNLSDNRILKIPVVQDYDIFKILFAVYILSLGPITEEFLFRLLPHTIYKSTPSFKRKNLIFSMSTSFLFGAAHISTYSLYNLPVSQFLIGIYLWRLMRDTNYISCVYFHSGANLITFIILVARIIF